VSSSRFDFKLPADKLDKIRERAGSDPEGARGVARRREVEVDRVAELIDEE